MKREIYLTKIIIFLILFSFIPIASATPATLELTPPTINQKVGDQFIVIFYVNQNQDADTIASDLITWDPSILSLAKIEHGDIFENWIVWLKGNIDNVNGRATGIAGASDVPANTSGQWIILTFVAIGSGTTEITANHFGVARAGNDLDKKILNTCTVTIIGDVPSQPPVDADDTIEPPQEVIPNDDATEENTTDANEPIGNDTNNETNGIIENETYEPTDKNTTKNETYEHTSLEPPQKAATSTETNIFILAVILVGILIAVIIIDLYLGKRKAPEEQDNEEDDDIFSEPTKNNT
jgi:hypothetical protein